MTAGVAEDEGSLPEQARESRLLLGKQLQTHLPNIICLQMYGEMCVLGYQLKRTEGQPPEREAAWLSSWHVYGHSTLDDGGEVGEGTADQEGCGDRALLGYPRCL